MSVWATFWLGHPGDEWNHRGDACRAIWEAPTGHQVIIREPIRNLDQNARLHALLADVVKAKPEWGGQKMGLDDWKSLFVHAVDVHEGRGAGRAVQGIEGGVVLLRRSTASMSKRELTELLDYIEATMTRWGIPVKDTRHNLLKDVEKSLKRLGP
jgi:hypothetical protein